MLCQFIIQIESPVRVTVRHGEDSRRLVHCKVMETLPEGVAVVMRLRDEHTVACFCEELLKTAEDFKNVRACIAVHQHADDIA